MKKILFPTDFSDASKNARRVAIKVAHKTGAELVVLHSLNTAQQYVNMSLTSVGDPTLPGFEPDLVLSALKEQTSHAEKEMESIVKNGSDLGIKVSCEISSGELIEDINLQCEENNIGLIVLGTHGASGFREAFLGSNAQKIVRLAGAPVLSVNEIVEDFDIKSIVYASDFLEEDVNKLIPRFIDFAKIFDAKLKLVYINSPAYFEDSKTSLKRIGAIVENYGVSMNDVTIYNDYNIEDGIIHYARMIDGDMIALATHGFRGLKKLISDNITETVVNHAKRPVLSIHC